MAKSIFNLKTFSNMIKASEQYGLSETQKNMFLKSAYQYRLETAGIEMPEEYNIEAQSETIAKSVEKIEEVVNEEIPVEQTPNEEVEITPKLMRKILKENGVKFSNAFKPERLLQLCQDNNLIEV